MDRSRARVGDIELQVLGLSDYETFDQTACEIYEVEYEGGIRRFAEFDLDLSGRPIGAEEAHRLAEKAVIQLEARGLKPQMKLRRVPAIALYIQSSNGTLHAIDAENGRTLWAVSVGRPQSPSLRPSANDHYVAVVNGSQLHLLRRTNGETVWQRDLASNPAFGPAMAREMVFVPGLNGEIEGYWLPTAEDSNAGRPPWVYRSAGRITSLPTVTATTVSWPTSVGQMYVAQTVDPQVRFRLDTGGPIQGSSVALPPSTLFVASTDGYIFSVDETTGDFHWDFSSGEAIRQTPVAIGDLVFALTEHHNLHCLSAEDGTEQWFASHVRGILGASEHQLYVSGRLGEIAALDLKTGGELGSFPAAGLDVRVVNGQTDRFYLGTRDGLLICLKTIGSDWPLVHLPLPQPPTEESTGTGLPSDADPAAGSGEDPSETMDDDPFAGGVFDNEPADGGAADDPFDWGADDSAPAGSGTDDDPFGTGVEEDAAGGADEAGAADDPFDFG